MKNDEKKPIAGDGEVENISASSESQGSANAWQKLSKGAKIGIISGACCLLAVIIVLIAVLGGCQNGKNPDKGNGGNGGSSNSGTQNNATYSVTVKTQGGLAMSKLPVYVHSFEDGSLGDLIDGGYGATDENGKVSFELPANGSYAIMVRGIPEGYNANSFYPLVSNNFELVLTSSVVPETSLTGITYSLGSVMRDFSVTTTTGDVFTLSEVLKEKKAVLINFWYTTCSWCITEFPLMQTAYEKYADDLAIIAIDPYADDTLAGIKSFQAEMGLTFDVAQEPFDTPLSTAFGVTGYPTSVMIDRYGVVTLIEAGAITSQRTFDILFDYFTADNYEQKLVTYAGELVPKEKPDVEMPSAEDIGEVFETEDLGDINYRNDDKDEYSWPFVIDQTDLNGVVDDVIKPSNAYKEASYAQLIFDVELKSGDVLAFDYFSSSELGADILYVVVNGKDIYSISGESSEWATCYAFVAEEDGSYEVGLIYIKDSSDDVGHDTVYLKDLRIVTEADIDSPTYIFRFAATNPDKFNEYQDYIQPVLGTDGYYHVGSANGPLLLADLMGYTRFSEDDTVYYMAVALYDEGKITAAQYSKIIEYCNYASNASVYGTCPVTPELEAVLKIVAEFYGNPDNENDWQRFCCYYDAYGTDGQQLEDPIKGLSLFSAYDVIVSEKGSTEFPNTIVYDRLIMPRGLLYKFSPTVSGTYLITSNAPDPINPGQSLETNAWIFTADGFSEREEWYVYENKDRFNNRDLNNCYMLLYFEAGKDYYIDIAYYDVYQEGTINFRIERLGGEGFYRFTLASPAYFSSLLSPDGELTETIAGGINVVLGEDGIWREKRTDGREGSILYADFTMMTPVFNRNIIDMIKQDAFNFALTEGDQYILGYLAMNDNDVEKCDAYLRDLWGDEYDTYAAIYNVEDVYAGIYHGEGEDYTELMKSYLSKIIVAGYNETLDETIAEDDARIGCVIVTEELAEVLQVLMDKYTFEGVENSWTKVCYYAHYFCAATPK